MAPPHVPLAGVQVPDGDACPAPAAVAEAQAKEAAAEAAASRKRAAGDADAAAAEAEAGETAAPDAKRAKPAEPRVRLNYKLDGSAAPCGYLHAALSWTLAELRERLAAEADLEVAKYGFVLNDAPASSKQEPELRVSDVFPCAVLRLLPAPRKGAGEKAAPADDSVRVVKQKATSPITGEPADRAYLSLSDPWLVEELRRQFGSLPGVHEEEVKVLADDLGFHLPALRSAAGSTDPRWARLLAAVEAHFAAQRALHAAGSTDFASLGLLFPKGSRVCSSAGGQDTLAFEVERGWFQRGWCGTSFLLEGVVVKSNGHTLFKCKERFGIRAFDGTRPIRDLPVQPLDPATEERLVARGRLFRRVALGAHYMTYAGSIMMQGWWSNTFYKADGRVMVDGRSFKLFNPEYEHFEPPQGADEGKIEELDDCHLFCAHHSVTGFAFSCKKWGEILLRGLGEISFDEGAFGRLVLEPGRKRTIEALVKHGDRGFSDVISGKGGGCIFLLHGVPGTGKTLTAEAISELLRRPLYSVSVGELGTTPADLEKRLREILEVAHAWNAVILIDEADIFLERRTLTDVTRNAMVGIFLRLLEYHQGVMFLTTNRVSSFDAAFHSRISVALKYPPLDAAAREAVWRSLLAAAGVAGPGLDPAALACHDLNGRQIKNTIRLAQSLARAEGRGVTAEDVEGTIALAAQFQTDILDRACDLDRAQPLA